MELTTITPEQAERIVEFMNSFGLRVSVADHLGRPAFVGAAGYEVRSAVLAMAAAGDKEMADLGWHDLDAWMVLALARVDVQIWNRPTFTSTELGWAA